MLHELICTDMTLVSVCVLKFLTLSLCLSPPSLSLSLSLAPSLPSAPLFLPPSPSLSLPLSLQVNGMTVEGKQHSEVVAAIKSGGEETSLLVVDTDTDAFFRRCRVAPTPEHITGETRNIYKKGPEHG